VRQETRGIHAALPVIDAKLEGLTEQLRLAEREEAARAVPLAHEQYRAAIAAVHEAVMAAAEVVASLGGAMERAWGNAVHAEERRFSFRDPDAPPPRARTAPLLTPAAPRERAALREPPARARSGARPDNRHRPRADVARRAVAELADCVIAPAVGARARQVEHVEVDPERLDLLAALSARLVGRRSGRWSSGRGRVGAPGALQHTTAICRRKIASSLRSKSEEN
jgi:hypothetical protein